MKVPLVADSFAETECENDAQNLDGDDADRNADYNVQMVDEDVIYGIIAALRLK